MIMKRFGLCLFMGLALLAASSCAHVDIKTDAHKDVEADFGAVGDGVTDDTAAIQKALDACAAEGGVVHVPAGHFLLAGHLNVPDDVTLEGIWKAPHAISLDQSAHPEKLKLKGSVLLVTEGAGQPEGKPFLTLNNSSALRGMTIFYPNQTQTNPPVAYPWTVASMGWDTAVIDVFMVNPYQAIDMSRAYVGRHTVRGLYAQALYRGIYVDDCHDIVRLEDVHLFPFWDFLLSPLKDFMEQEADAFVIARTDWQQMTNCFCIGYRTGYRFINSPRTDALAPGPGNVIITGGGADAGGVAVRVEQTQTHAGVSFANCQIFGDIIVEPTNGGPVRFTGCAIFGTMKAENGVRFAKTDGAGPVSFVNCHFRAIHPDAAKAKMGIQAVGGRLTVSSCLFNDVATDEVVLEPGVQAAVVMGNQFAGEKAFVNRSQGKVQAGMNVEGALPSSAADEKRIQNLP